MFSVCECGEDMDNGEDTCDECATSLGLMFTACGRCDWFGIPISPDGFAPELCAVCEWVSSQ